MLLLFKDQSSVNWKACGYESDSGKRFLVSL